MTFSIFFWNIWYINQVKDDVRHAYLLEELHRLIRHYNPDFLGLSEVVKPTESKVAPVIQYLEKLGYNHSHFTNMTEFDNYWRSGVSLSSRLPISKKRIVAISKNGYAAQRGHPGLNKEAAITHIHLPNGTELKIIVAHPQDTIHSLHEHKTGMRSLDQLVHSTPYTKNTILIGDMNEWRLIPKAFKHRVADVMDSRTGTIINPTWRHNAHRFTPLRLNLDYVYWSKESDFYLKDFKVLPSDVSDHKPLLATFEYSL